MYFDMHASIGHWPFRKLENNTASSLRTLLESHGIDGAAVGNINGIFYMNCQDANLELAKEIEGHRDFFAGVAVLNPAYAAWERDLEYCVKVLDFKALRLYPKYHNYNIFSVEAIAIAKAAASYGIPVIVPQMMVDFRQMHWMDLESIVDVAELGKLCLAVPEAKFIATELWQQQNLLTGVDGKPLHPNLYVETSRFRSAYGQHLAKLAKNIGADHILFGSGAPFREVSPAILRMDCADLSQEDKLKISSLNARSLLKI